MSGTAPVHITHSHLKFSPKAAVNSCTQRTGKPFERRLLFSGFTLPLLKSKFEAFTLDAEAGELLHE